MADKRSRIMDMHVRAVRSAVMTHHASSDTTHILDEWERILFSKAQELGLDHTSDDFVLAWILCCDCLAGLATAVRPIEEENGETAYRYFMEAFSRLESIGLWNRVLSLETVPESLSDSPLEGNQ